MRAVLIASECEPWAKTGGLADVVDALARALERLPHGPDQPVDVFLPRYRSVPL
ncbi:MAG: glycogen/starch synthase, partial [Candidatus Limnocylindrales bacterium]